MKLDEIINSLFNEAKSGEVCIACSFGADWKYFVGFETKIGDQQSISNLPTIIIPNLKQFETLITQYLSIAKSFYTEDQKYFDLTNDSYIKKLILDLIVNASSYDFENFYSYISLKTKMLTSKQVLGNLDLGQFSYYNKNKPIDFNISATIIKNKSNIEAPFCFTPICEDEFSNTFQLPSINFAIVDNICYVYSIQNLNKQDKNALSKTLDRLFRQVNNGVDEEFLNISPNALVGFTIFNEYLKQNKIDKIVSPNFLPIRYNEKICKNVEIYSQEPDILKIKLEEIDRVQYNITNKFMDMFLRYNLHFDNTNISYNDIKDEINLIFQNHIPTSSNNILHKISSCIRVKNDLSQLIL